MDYYQELVEQYLNPNMELLFQGPQLRPFNFTFRLSPRDQKEAEASQIYYKIF
jgi:hypothetical protein